MSQKRYIFRPWEPCSFCSPIIKRVGVADPAIGSEQKAIEILLLETLMESDCRFAWPDAIAWIAVSTSEPGLTLSRAG